MSQPEYPLFIYNAHEPPAPPVEQLLQLVRLSPQMQQRLLEDLHALVRIQQEVMAAQQVLTQIDLYALNLAYRTVDAAEFMKLVYGSSPALEAFDCARREQYLQSMHDLVTQAQAQILARLQRS
jgi:hypothetical protein